MGGLSAIVEVDETSVGKYDDIPHRVKGYAMKLTVLTLVERGGQSRSFHVGGSVFNRAVAVGVRQLRIFQTPFSAVPLSMHVINCDRICMNQASANSAA